MPIFASVEGLKDSSGNGGAVLKPRGHNSSEDQGKDWSEEKGDEKVLGLKCLALLPPGFSMEVLRLYISIETKYQRGHWPQHCNESSVLKYQITPEHW